MKKNLLLTLVSVCFAMPALAAVTEQEALTLACDEAARVGFQFETSCEDDFYAPEKVTAAAFHFLGLDASGDCGIRVVIDRETGAARSQVSCY